MPDEWISGEPPHDGRTYEMRQQCSMAGREWTVWVHEGWWDGKQLVRRNLFHGGTEPLLFCSHYRPCHATGSGDA